MSWSTGILGLGSIAVDDLIFATYAPPNIKTPIHHRERHFGGQTATALYAAARLGAKCAYAGVTGTDELSQSAVDNLRQAGIDLQYLRQIDQAHAVHSTIIVDEEKHTRNIYYHSSPFAGAALDWPPETVLQACRVLLVDQHGIAGMTRAAGIARAAGIPVVCDLESAPPGSELLLSHSDHLIVPDVFAMAYSGKNDPAAAATALWSPDRTAVVVTCGEKGAWYFEQGMVEPSHYPAFPVMAVDTTGCGDVFHGVYAVGVLEGFSLRERVRLASAAAAMKATRRGGQTGCPDRSSLKLFLEP
jgi:sulfofructose kinase